MPASTTQLTTLFPNSTLSRLERLRINAARFTNKRRGEHRAGRGGSSTDFSDYRDYVPGDDVRYVDWNIFARLRRPYLKLYHQEEERHVVVLIDASSSMIFEDKLARAQQLAAAFGVMGLIGGERVSMLTFREAQGRPAQLHPCRGRASLRKMLHYVEGIEGGGDAPIEDGIEALLGRHSGRGVAVLLSDFLTMGEMKRTFNMLFSAGLEIWGVQILGPSELEPEVSGDMRLVDSESGMTLDISSAADLLAIYQEYREAHERELSLMCSKRGGRFLSSASTAPLEFVLFDLMRRNGWVQ